MMSRRQKDMQERLENLREEAVQAVESVDTTKDLQEIRVLYLGKKGAVTEVLKGMGKLSKEERPKIGQLANEVRDAITAAIETKEEVLEKEALEKQLIAETIDVTLPGRPVQTGGPH